MVERPTRKPSSSAGKIAALTAPKTIGPNDATILTHEVFYRGYRTRNSQSWVGVANPLGDGDVMAPGMRDGPAMDRPLIQMAALLRYRACRKWFNCAGSRGRSWRSLATTPGGETSREDWRHAV